MNVDFGQISDDYARFRPRFPDELYERLAQRGIGRAGQALLDLGTGTGNLARGFAQRGARVSGLDPSFEQLKRARLTDAQADVRVHYALGRAEHSPFHAHVFDAVSAAQCWHWFEVPRVCAEIRRLLAAGGQLAIVSFDWLPELSSVVAATERLIRTHNPGWTLHGGDGLHPEWLRDLETADFGAVESFQFDVALEFTHEAWRGRIRSNAGVGASLSDERVTLVDGELERLLESSFPEQPLSIPHRIFVVTARA